MVAALPSEGKLGVVRLQVEIRGGTRDGKCNFERGICKNLENEIKAVMRAAGYIVNVQRLDECESKHHD